MKFGQGSVTQQVREAVGTGTGVCYVYTASEGTALLERCELLMPLIQPTL